MSGLSASAEELPPVPVCPALAPRPGSHLLPQEHQQVPEKLVKPLWRARGLSYPDPRLRLYPAVLFAAPQALRASDGLSIPFTTPTNTSPS